MRCCKIWDLLRNLTRWLLNHRGVALDIASIVARYAPGVGELRAALPRVLTRDRPRRLRRRRREMAGHGHSRSDSPRALRPCRCSAPRSTSSKSRTTAERPVERVASIFFEIGQALEIDSLRRQIENLPVESRWHAQARGSLRDELAAQHRALVTQILASAPPRRAESACRPGSSATIRR